MVHNHQELVRDGHGRLLPPKAHFKAPKRAPQKCRRLARRPGTLYQHAAQVTLAGRVRPCRRLPALSLFPGATLAHDEQARRGAKTTHIRPVSARISRAAVMSTPGMLSSCAIWPTFKGVWSATANFAPCHPLIPGLVNSHSITNDQMVVLDAMNLAARCPFYKFAASNAGERL